MVRYSHVRFERNVFLRGYMRTLHNPQDSETYQEHRNSDLDLTLRAKNGDQVRGCFFVRKVDFGISLRLNIVYEDTLLAEESPVILAGNGHYFVNVILILLASSEKRNY